MTLLYVDTSALIKRVFAEPESDGLIEALGIECDGGAQAVTSVLARVEASRTTLRRRADIRVEPHEALGIALQGIAQAPITEVVVELAHSIAPPLLRALDAIHLATAVAVGADEVWTYDLRLTEAATRAGFIVRAPA